LSGKRVSLKKSLREIRQWAAEGKDDERIADALGSTASSVQSFRSRNGIPHYKRSTEATFASLGISTGSEVYEGVLEEREGRYAIWFDPGVSDSEAYGESWGNLERIEVRVSPEKIVLLRRSVETETDGYDAIVEDSAKTDSQTAVAAK
jgi:hypothetical protein